MKFCTSCGRQRKGASRFCTRCGMPFSEELDDRRVAATVIGEAQSGFRLDDSSALISDSPRVPTDSLPAPREPDTVQQRSAVPVVVPDGHVHGNDDRTATSPAVSLGKSPRAVTPGTDSGWPEPPGPRPPRPGATRQGRGAARRKVRWFAVLAVFLLVTGAGAATWWFTGHHGLVTATRQPGRARANRSAGGSPTTRAQPSHASSAPSPAQGSARPLVLLGPDVSASAFATRLQAWVTEYFTAINERSFSRYRALLEPQLRINESAQSFHKGFRTTSDSQATITDITTASTGAVQVEITFTSHQAPSDSPTGTEACTNWDISLFLQQFAGRYLMMPAPAGYRSVYTPC